MTGSLFCTFFSFRHIYIVRRTKEKVVYMTTKWCNFYKNLAQIYLPALATLYFALASIWGLPYVEQVVGTITAIDTFLGVCLGICTSQSKKDKDTNSEK
jgi:hypothetical protein